MMGARYLMEYRSKFVRNSWPLSERRRWAVILILVTGGLVQADEPRPWPYSRPTPVDPPAVHDASWVKNPIDAFILAKLEAQGIRPADEADKRTLIRRLFFDLIGLPPTPDDVAAFLGDDDPKAYEVLVDRLLKDKRYGERWARLWLDLARYADTAGFEGDPDLPHAWRYRDYVIDAFNDDKPYDLFIKEQIAGDEFQEILGAGDLPSTPPERVVAMTFLRLAPFTEPRGDETRHELLSEMTTTVSSVFLGLTVGCAKCHDHKYDPIPTKDFYRMKAFFATISMPRPEPGDGFQIGGPLPAAFYRPDEEAWAAKRLASLDGEVESAKRELSELTAKLEKRLGGAAGFGLQAMGGPLENDYIFEQAKVNDGKLHWTVANAGGGKWEYRTDGQSPRNTGSSAGSNRGQWFARLPSAKHVSLGQYNAGSGGPQDAYHVGRFADIMIYDHPLNDDERRSLHQYVERKFRTANEGQTASPPQNGLAFWLDASDLDADTESPNPKVGAAVSLWRDKIGGVTISQSSVELQPKLETLEKAPAVAFDKDFLIGPVGDAAFLDDEEGAIVVIYSATHTHEGYGFEVGGDGAMLTTFINPSAGVSNLARALNDPNSDITDEERELHQYLSTRDRFVGQQRKRLKPLAMSLRHSYGPPYEPGVPTSRVMIRGEYDNPGEVVYPGFLTAITGHSEPAAIRLDPFKRWPTRSRRMALAQWIASADNPLTARVMCNRLWQWHLGKGIVATPSDFGELSGGPSHPELLDWLAATFVDKGWRVKEIHRLIVTSATYRQSSETTAQPNRADANVTAVGGGEGSSVSPADVDPENTLFWKFRRRRLEAEAVRDAILSVSGRLNPEQFGLPIFPPLPDGIAERVKYSSSKWDTQRGPEGRKRSIYIYQQRTLTMPFMQAFDSLVCDESRPRRRASVTPLQALAMYNGDFVNAEADHFAQRVTGDGSTSLDRQIDRAFVLAFGRPPNDEERTVFANLASESDAGMTAVCRVLFNSNEFVYVD